MREFVTVCMWLSKLVCPRVLAACHFSLAVKGCGINRSLCAQIMKCRCVTEHVFTALLLFDRNNTVLLLLLCLVYVKIKYKLDFF